MLFLKQGKYNPSVPLSSFIIIFCSFFKLLFLQVMAQIEKKGPGRVDDKRELNNATLEKRKKKNYINKKIEREINIIWKNRKKKSRRNSQDGASACASGKIIKTEKIENKRGERIFYFFFTCVRLLRNFLGTNFWNRSVDNNHPRFFFIFLTTIDL